MYVSLHLSSLSVGLAISLTMIWFTRRDIKLKKLNNNKLIVFAIFFLIHYLLTMFFNQNITLIKYFFSFLFVLFLLISAFVLSDELSKLQDENVIHILKIISSTILFFGILSLVVNVNFLNYSNYGKSIFPFAEPSHYVLAMSGILLATGFYLSSIQKIFLLGIITTFIVLYQSVLMLMFLFLVIFSYYTVNITKSIMTVSILSVLIFIFLNNSEDASYYLDRLNFSNENHNLTSLVYIQGWSDAYNSFFNTGGIGLGFQNMGMQKPNEISELIYTLSGEYKNRKDGGFLMAKIIGEFGFLGLLVIFFYIIQLFKSISYLRSFVIYKAFGKSRDIYFPVKLIFAHSVIFAFCIEMFARGYGYFSPGVFLVIVAFFLIQKNKIYYTKELI